MTICPCCGGKVAGSLSAGCTACGARSVGEPLPKPSFELPSYARSLLLAVTGSLMMITFLAQMVIALAAQATFSLAPAALLAAGQTAAWRMKWVGILMTVLVIWGTRKIYHSMKASPDRFCGWRYARSGYATSVFVPVLIAVLIGITVPARLHQRELARQAGEDALLRTVDRAMFQYKLAFESMPADASDLRKLPDPDGSIAAALQALGNQQFSYKPTAEVAARQKPQPLRGAVLRNASLTTPATDALAESLSFTNYELTLPGPDKLLGTEDDITVRDGVISRTPSGKAVVPVVSTNPARP